jgi:hypothetical protein
MADDSIPISEPDTFTAGDTASWRRSFILYPAGAGWVLSYALRKRPEGTALAFSATADGDWHVVNVDAATTALWPPGDYDGQGYVTNGTERYKVWEGTLTIEPNFAGNYAVDDTRSHARRVLDNLNLVIEGRAKDDVLNSTIEGTVIYRITPEQLMLLHDRYTVKVRNEEDAKKKKLGRATGRRILTRFSRTVSFQAGMGESR